jgi:8-oxo-dGTP diphosphatase
VRTWTFTEKIRRIVARWGGVLLVTLYWNITKSKSSRTRAIIVSEDKTEILLVKNITAKEFHLPGGGIDSGESSENAVLREVKEELGINVNILYKLGKYIYQGTNKYVEIFVVQAQTKTFTMQWELDEARWFSFKEIPSNVRRTSRQALRDFLAQNQPVTGIWGLED